MPEKHHTLFKSAEKESRRTVGVEIMRIRPDIPVILCTGFSHAMSEKKAKTLGIRFITPRRGKKLVGNLDQLSPWERIHIPHDKRKYPDPYVHQSLVTLKDYEGQIRQIILRGNGREDPAFLVTNDVTAPGERLVSDYAHRWRVDNVISEAVKFFNLNALSSPILVKVHFDVLMTMIADTLYSRLAQKLRGFEQCDAQKFFRHFIRGKADVDIISGQVRVTYPRRAHNPILREVPWHRLPQRISWLDGAKLNFKFT